MKHQMYNLNIYSKNAVFTKKVEQDLKPRHIQNMFLKLVCIIGANFLEQ